MARDDPAREIPVSRRKETGGFEPPDQGDGQRLWNLGLFIPEAERFTRIYRGMPDMIDHIFASHVVAHGMERGDIRAVDTGIRAIADVPTPQIETGSDHRPLMVDIAT